MLFKHGGEGKIIFNIYKLHRVIFINDFLAVHWQLRSVTKTETKWPTLPSVDKPLCFYLMNCLKRNCMSSNTISVSTANEYIKYLLASCCKNDSHIIHNIFHKLILLHFAFFSPQQPNLIFTH